MARARHNIVLCGFMGAGKSTVAALMGTRYGFSVVDTDRVIESMAGRPIGDIFRTEGEARFRAYETEVLHGLSGRRGMVVATGGGIVLAAGNRRLLESLGLVVYLKVPFEELLYRLQADGGAAERPLASDGGKLRSLFNARRPVYEALPFSVDAGGSDPVHTAEKLMRLYLSCGGVAPSCVRCV